MYKEDIDFYSLNKQKQNRLISNKQVAVTGELLTEFPDGQPAVRVFEKSLDHLTLDLLERGQYTIAQLAEHFGVKDTDIRPILHKYRRRGADRFTGENFKQNLLLDRNGILRGVRAEGSSLYYSLETIPFFARVIDPTLGFSLLKFDERLADYPRVVDHIPGGKATELDEDYAFVIGDHWGIDPEEVFDLLTEHDREYINTSLLPLPRTSVPGEYERVVNRFEQADSVYKRYRVDGEDVKELGSDFLTRFKAGQVGLANYQTTIIELADLQWHARHINNHEFQRTVDHWIDKIADTLHPDATPTDDESDVSSAMDVDLRDEIQLALGETPMTPSKVLESLPRDIRLSASETEVAETLERLANAGTISKEVDRSEDSPKYLLDGDQRSWR